MALASEQRLDIAVQPAEIARLVHIGADAREALEILLDVGACLFARNAQLVGEAECRDAVDDAEIDRLGAAADVGRHVLDRHAEHFRRGHRVDVDALLERGAQRRHVGDFREQPQLDLRIIRRDQLVAGGCDEGAADLAAVLGTHRDVLKVGFVRRQPPRRGRRQRIGGVDTMGLRMHVVRQRVGIGRAQFRDLPPVENLARQFVALLGQLIQHLRRGRPRAGLGLRAPRQAHLAEQHVAELLRAADVNFLAGDLADLGLDARGGLREIRRQSRQHLAVDRNAAPLHPRQHADQRPLQRLVHSRHVLGRQPRLQHPPQP